MYDYSVYGVADFFATAQADRRTEIQGSMLKSENLIGHYTSTTATAKAQLTVTDNRLVRYILIVFNKSAGDPGNSNVSTAGQYGADHLPGLATPATNGGLYVSEIEVFGDPLTNLLTPAKITAGTQSIKSYKVPTPTTATAKLWDIQYPQSYGTASDHYTSLITSGANGVYDDNLVDGDTATYAWRAWGLDGSNGNRLVHWIDLGDLYFLNSMILHTTTAKTCVYDYSVYASNVVSDINALLTADHLIGRYSSAKQNAQALSTLDDSVKVRYVAVVLNKLATDPGNSNDTSATASNYYVDTNNRLPGGSYSNGSLHLTEIQVMGEIATPKAAKTFTDDATGLKVDLTTYKTNHQEIDTMAVTQTALSDAQKAVVETADGKVAPGGVYHIAFKDASGAEVTDLRDWEFVVTVPAAKGVDAVLYQLDDQQLPIALNAQKGNGVFTFACKGNAFIHDVIAAATGNLLDIDKLKNGTQKLSGHNVAAPGLLIWDYTNPYTYGTVTDRVAFTESVHAAFVDGNTNTNVYQYGFGSESAGADATYPWDHVAQRRLALFADLGAGYNVSNIDLRIGSTTVYDCSVYASSVASDAASLLKAENLVKHYTGTTAGSINIPLQDINNKRFFLIVFNKLSSDPGNASKTYDGRYGTADAAQVGSTYPSGGLNITELVFSGVESNPTKEQSFTDTATGITVDMTTYETHYTNVSSMTVTTNTLTDEQKAVVETADGKVAPNGLYNIVFKDANGAEVTDLSDWAFRVTVPLVKGLDKVLYRLDAQQLPVLLDTVIKDGKFTYASEGTFYGDIIAAAKENLLSGDKVAAGTQKITGYNLASNGLLIWDYEHPYTYGAATARSAFSAEILAKLTDGDVENGAFPYGFGSESINVNAENKWDVVANRRLAMFVDLGAGYNVREIDWVLNSGKVYDCSVYASSYAATPATLLKESNLVARYESTDGGNLNFALQNVKNKRYFLFVFNKVHSDPGNASFTCDGRYGTADAAQTGIAYPSGGVYVSEIAFSGELAVPTKAQSFTDAATGVKVDMATFNDSYQNVASVSVEKKALTDAQNALIKADGKVAPNGTYRLVFKDASGAEVTDLSDWEYTVSVPAAKGTEKVLYALDAQKVPVRLEIEPVDGMFTVSSIDTNAREFIAAAKENLLDIDKIKEGTQKITGHNVASQGLLIWDYKHPYTYGDVSSRALFSETILDKMVDGDTVAGAFPYGFGSESINANAENKWDVVAKRRLGLFVDLGGGYNVNTVQLMLSAGQVYDCSVYASNIAATPDALLKASNLVARYESVEGGDLEFALQNVLNKRYFLFVFNKVHSDPGNASFT
ncbi:MAG: hypothetical protein IJP14_04800, partial [Clostridia bacterium]|nr:hypothetical protein [Clostridia bacterium]